MEDLERGFERDEGDNDSACSNFADDDEVESGRPPMPPTTKAKRHQAFKGPIDAFEEDSLENQSQVPASSSQSKNDRDPDKPVWVRRKESLDIETGRSLGHTSVCQAIRDELYSRPMDPNDRWWKQFRRGPEYNNQRRPPIYQYRFTSRKTSRGFWNLLINAAEEDFHVIRGVNVAVANYLLWTFQNPMVLVFISAAAMYTFLIVTFGAMIYGLGRYEPECLIVNEEDFDVRGHHFIDAISLSWQTFSTAGFGAVRPALGRDHHSCVWLNMLAALESFVGVLFIGFCTAVIFGKVIRVQANANVEFSDPIVVRYGNGVLPADEDGASESSGEHPGNDKKILMRSESIRNLMHGKDFPCPVLEFRVLNQFYDQLGGEICNATVHVVATKLSNEGDDAIFSKRGSQSKHKRRMLSSSLHSGSIMLQGSALRVALVGDRLLRRTGASRVFRKSGAFLRNLNPLSEHPFGDAPDSEPVETLGYDEEQPPENMRSPVMVEEESSESLVPRRAFFKMEIATDHHPFLKRIWTVRHVLNETSPLLSKKARKLIAANSGFWPKELNGHEKVRKHIHFHQIIVNFSGISNVSGSPVYAQKVYDKVDMNIGYRHAPMLFKSGDGRLIVDASLLNDVMEQHGGGAEPFENVLLGNLPFTKAMATAARTSADIVRATTDAAFVVGKATVASSANAFKQASQDAAAAGGYVF